MNSPDMSTKPGGEETVKLYMDYKEIYLPSENVLIFFHRNVDFRFYDAVHVSAVLFKVGDDLTERFVPTLTILTRHPSQRAPVRTA